ncbi:MAG: hypothetical protein UZ22_OP11002000569 [Microgenomates bacterium OLB23]|nr:MAG: hypothetical protein UZ22_OP11002000569 [Microgenomates bacterium OLB23]
MTVEINLLRKHKTSKLTQRLILALRVVTILVGSGVLLTLSSLFVLKKNIENELVTKTDYYNNLMSRIAKNQDKETAALMLNAKYKAIDTVIKAEPPYFTYYQTLMRDLPQASDSGRIKNISIQKTGSAVVQLTFPDILAMTKFLSQLESDTFQKNYSSVHTSNISFAQDGLKEITFSLNVKF